MRRPKNLAATLWRLLPALWALPFRLLLTGPRGLYFKHPSARILGKVAFGRMSEIGAHTFFNAGPRGIVIGSYSQINPCSSVVGDVTIGARTLVAPGCVLAQGGHTFGKGVQPRFSGGKEKPPLTIGDDVWIGANVTIVGSITVGDNCVISAGVVLDRDVPPCTIVRRASVEPVFEPLR